MAAVDEKRWYVYVLCDPETEQPFYVGKGTGNRLHMHGQAADNSNLRKRQIIQQIQLQGKSVLRKKIAEFSNEKDAYIYEFAMICLYSASLTNIHRCNSFSEDEASRHPVPDDFIGLAELSKLLGVHSQEILKKAKLAGVQRYYRNFRNQSFYKREDIETLRDWFFTIRPAEGK